MVFSGISSIVMFSGGLDSTVALFWALKEKRYAIKPITFDYFRRSRKERRAAARILQKCKLRSINVDLNFLREVSDMKGLNRNKKLSQAPSAYVPARNAILYGIASSFAEILDCRYIIGGHNKDDGASFPDSSRAFFQTFNKLTSLGLYTRGRTSRVVLPLSNLRKAEVVKLGRRLGVPFEMTWSCYYQYQKHCGRCPSCMLRIRAFSSAGIRDPLNFMASS